MDGVHHRQLVRNILGRRGLFKGLSRLLAFPPDIEDGERMAYLFKLMKSGVVKPAGIVDVPFLGAKVGEFANWTLTRRGDTGRDADLYDLRAAFSFVSEALWEDPDYDKRVIVNITPKKQYRLVQVPGYATVRQGSSLLMEGVQLDDIQGPGDHA